MNLASSRAVAVGALARNRRVARLLLFWAACLLCIHVRAADTGMFVETNPLLTARFGHSATLLPNGKVIVAGGGGLNGVILGSAELYDPKTGTWTSTGSLVEARYFHPATLLPNGKVLVTGGYGPAGPLASAELYDPATGMWTLTGSLPNPRYYDTATLLSNGKVLIAGGGDSSGLIAVAELYDPTSGTWSATGSLVIERQLHTATLLSNGKVLVAGGLYFATRSSELYDPISGEWTLNGEMLSENVESVATLLPNGKVLVAGHDDVNSIDAELYDPGNGTWRATSNPIPAPDYGHTATLLENGNVLLVGGYVSGSAVGRGEVYDPENETWKLSTNDPVPGRGNHTATLLPNGEVLVAGGNAQFGQVFDSALLYVGGTSPQTPTPTPTETPIPTATASSTVTPTVTPTVTASPEPTSSPISITILGNISTRLNVGTDDNVLIGGFIISGSDPKRVLLRGLGPSLPVAATLADPALELHGPSGFATIMCDNWRECPGFTGPMPPQGAPPNDLEAAMIVTLAPGAYTAILSGKNNTSGLGLVEVYDLAPAVDSKLANISTRGLVQTGDNAMIAGMIVLGDAPQRVIVRALGPSLSVAGKLTDPTLELRDGNGGLIGSNDNWRSDHEAEIIATGIPPPDDLESAIVATLPAGGAAYTAIVRGVNNATGVAVVEAYASD